MDVRTIPQGATKSVTHMMSAMSKVLRSCIPEIMMQFLYDITMKGCVVEEKDETMDDRGCRTFVVDHIHDYEKVLRKLDDVHLTLSGEKSTFGQEEILVVEHLCGPYRQRPSPTKIYGIQAMKEICKSQSDVRRFLGACAFYHIWIAHYVHTADLLYNLLRKGEGLATDASVCTMGGWDDA